MARSFRRNLANFHAQDLEQSCPGHWKLGQSPERSSSAVTWLIKCAVVDRPHHTAEEREVYHPTSWEQERGTGREPGCGA